MTIGRDNKGRCAPIGLIAVATLLPSPAKAWWNDDWSLRKKITIDASASGGNITDSTGTTPVLVRLHVAISASRPRRMMAAICASSPATTRPAQISHRKIRLAARRSPGLGIGAHVQAGAKTEIWLYCGNKKAAAATDAKGTYDPDRYWSITSMSAARRRWIRRSGPTTRKASPSRPKARSSAPDCASTATQR